MTDMWIGLIGTLLGTLLGAGIASLVSLRSQQREPKLLLLEKRIEAYSEINGNLYYLADYFRKSDYTKEGTTALISEFQCTFLKSIFLLDNPSREKLAAVYNFLCHVYQEGEINPHDFEILVNNALKQLHEGIGFKIA